MTDSEKKKALEELEKQFKRGYLHRDIYEQRKTELEGEEEQPDILLTTTPSLEGWQINEYFGPVSAHVVAGVGLISELFASFSDAFGGKSQTYSKHLKSLREDVFAGLRREAAALGANCVVNVRIDFDQISGQAKSMLMVTATGTAVKAEKMTKTNENTIEGD